MPNTMPAWQRREMQRQHLLEKASREMLLIGTEHSELKWSDYLFALTGIILNHLKLNGKTHEGHEKGGKAHETIVSSEYFEATLFFEEDLWGPIYSFGKSPEEKLALLAKFLQKYLLPTLLYQYEINLSRQENADPVRIFGASSTDEVPIKD